MGDGILIEFPSAVDAVRCAIEVQRGMVSRNAGLAQDQRIEFRVGIHVGDVVADGGDLLGDGVNVAARLEGISETGGIALSEDAFRQVQGKIAAEFIDLGEQVLKNIARPVRVYRVEAGNAANPGRPALSLPDRPSIAVLPFQNMSGDAEQEYFADGMVEDITTGLSRIRWLFVIARNSSFAYKGKSPDIRQVGRELGVRYVLEGSVRKGGNRVRITSQLVDAQTGAHLWAERYDRALDDVFALQDEITLSVVSAIAPSLRTAEIERVKRKRPDSLAAWELVFRAWPYLYSRMPADADQAIPLLRKALELEPGYAIAHAALAWCFHARFYRGGLHDADDVASVEHARATIESGNDDATALAIAAFVLSTCRERDLATALGLFERAIALSPSCAIALGYGAATLAMAGQTDLAIERALQALRLSPFDPFRYAPYGTLSFAYFLKGRFDEAAETARRSVENNPRFSGLYKFLVAALVRLGQLEAAKTTAKQLMTLQPQFTIGLVAAEYASVPRDGLAAFLDALRQAGLPE
ncbi:MAG TPA: adenylate/guanylate cyclase domain-containing protein [Stellaceae bacterium]|nr:adenylate/guanylate cyclase domain-containing protein [Stellaceae bacterium]